MNNLKQKLKIREARMQQVANVKALRESGLKTGEISRKLHISESTVRKYINQDGIKPISRNTWKEYATIKPTKEGFYFVSSDPLNDHLIIDTVLLLDDAVKEMENPKGEAPMAFWCGPISEPKYDLAEIEMERKLRNK